MNEISLISKIKSILDSKYIGDDCAYLSDFGIVITQDSLVEDVHFKRDLITPYQLGYKSMMVNISDVAASGACPKYITCALSLSQDIKEEYVEEFYRGAKTACDKYDIEIVGGDITAGDKIFISVSAIGSTESKRISSRKNAKIGHKIITTSHHGSSAAGLRCLLEGKDSSLIYPHLMPEAEVEFAKTISESVMEDYAMMDTSDGLFDALFKIGQASGVTMRVEFDKVEYDSEIEMFEDYKDLVLFGGEDYNIVATVPSEIAQNYTVIGEVLPKSDCVVEVVDGEVMKYNDISDKCFQHFVV